MSSSSPRAASPATKEVGVASMRPKDQFVNNLELSM